MTIIRVMMRRVFELIYAPRVARHVRAIERRYHSFIRKTIESRLRHQPYVESRNRKPLKRPVSFGATWELRFGPDNCFRVFYDIDTQTSHVNILAIGVKEKEKLFIAGEEIEL